MAKCNQLTSLPFKGLNNKLQGYFYVCLGLLIMSQYILSTSRLMHVMDIRSVVLGLYGVVRVMLSRCNHERFKVVDVTSNEQIVRVRLASGLEILSTRSR